MVSNSNVSNIAVSCHTAAAVVTTLAGSGIQGNANGTGTAASFNYPEHIAVDTSGNVYVADSGNNLIRKVTPTGVVTTLAGSGIQGNANGTGTAASFNNPGGVTVDVSGNVYVADFRNNLIRKITPAGMVTTLAGDGSHNSANGIGTAASFAFPGDVTVDAAGNVYVADVSNYMIRKITPAGLVTTYAGIGSPALPLYGNGPANTASFALPDSVAVDALGNVYVADTGNNSIRKITAAGMVSSLAGDLYANSGSANGTGTAATFSAPTGVAVDASGNVYVSDSGNNLIRKITAAGVVTTIAGNASDTSINGTGTAAGFRNPVGVAVDSSGNLYVSDSGSHLIRKISAQ
ncbi:NHL repeat-containing protein [Undibacterium sp.]|uniref:NHL repeat-containing protein n=1 Tax=Undibacterium sp. TaxID=1914977 RepID=UPI002B63F242|nr:NHL repeat-containing protein [Undibacterium sp.]HTD07152.1 NHL repeat-containing protein [Undibacterium sp.]